MGNVLRNSQLPPLFDALRRRTNSLVPWNGLFGKRGDHGHHGHHGHHGVGHGHPSISSQPFGTVPPHPPLNQALPATLYAVVRAHLPRVHSVLARLPVAGGVLRLGNGRASRERAA